MLEGLRVRVSVTLCDRVGVGVRDTRVRVRVALRVRDGVRVAVPDPVSVPEYVGWCSVARGVADFCVAVGVPEYV